MDMNRPSIYAAFGDKQTLYRQALDHYRARVRMAINEVLDEERPLRDALRDFYERAIEMYLSGQGSGRGCFVNRTALTDRSRTPNCGPHSLKVSGVSIECFPLELPSESSAAKSLPTRILRSWKGRLRDALLACDPSEDGRDP